MLYRHCFEILDDRYGLDYVESLLPFPIKIVVGCSEDNSAIVLSHDIYIQYKYDSFDDSSEMDYTFSFYIGNELIIDGQVPYGNTSVIVDIYKSVVGVCERKIREVEKKNQEKIYELEHKNAFFLLCLYFGVYNNKDLFLHYLKKAAFKNPNLMRDLIGEYKCGNKKQTFMGRKLNYNLVNKKHKKN